MDINTDERIVDLMCDEAFAFVSMAAMRWLESGVQGLSNVGIKLIADNLNKQISRAIGTGVWPIRIQIPVYQLHLMAFPLKVIKETPSNLSQDAAHAYTLIAESLAKMGYNLDALM